MTDWIDLVESRLRYLVDSLPARSAELSIRTTAANERTVSIRPSRPSAAPIVVNIVLDEATIVCGRGTVFEVPRRGHRYTERSGQDETLAICESVVRRGLNEKVWVVGDEVVRSVGTTVVDGVPIRVRWARIFMNPFAKRSKVTIEYDAYT